MLSTAPAAMMAEQRGGCGHSECLSVNSCAPTLLPANHLGLWMRMISWTRKVSQDTVRKQADRLIKIEPCAACLVCNYTSIEKWRREHSRPPQHVT